MADQPQSNAQRRQQARKELSKSLKQYKRAETLGPLKMILTTVLVLGLISGVLWTLITKDDSTNLANADQSQLTPTSTPPVPVDEVCGYTQYGTPPPGKDVGIPTSDGMKTSGTTEVTFETNYGLIPVTLDSDKAPCAVNSMVFLAKAGYYNDTICHRILNDNDYGVLQCGDPTGSGTGSPGYTFNDEYPVTDPSINDLSKPMSELMTIYPRGILAMANSGLNTNGSQFFFVYKDSKFAPSYTQFGTISDEGLATLDKISADDTENHSKKAGPEVPANTVEIYKVTVN